MNTATSTANQKSYDTLKLELESIQKELQSGSVPIGDIQSKVKLAASLYQEAEKYLKSTQASVEEVIKSQKTSI